MLIRLLGPTEVTGDGALSRRDRVVLAALVVHGREPASVEVLADALWGEQVPASATKVVQGAVMRLRRVLGAESIQTTAAGYRLTLDGTAVDTHAFERLVARGRELAGLGEHDRAATAFDESLALWRGAPLPDLVDWDPGRAEADRLVEVRRAVEEELLEARMSAGHAGNAVADAQRLVTREPYREHRWVLLALSLYRAGRQRDALDAVRRARSTLLDELGLDPGPELLALEQQILTQDPVLLDVPSAAEASTTCPYPGLRPFDAGEAEFYAGREAEVVEHLTRLEAFPLLVVVGASGSGKSSLVRAGIAPALREAGDTVVVITPGASPGAVLAETLAASPQPDVLVVDQLEELFLAPGGDVAAVLARLAELVRDGRRVVCTVRADHLAELSRSADLVRLVEQGLLLLGPMTEDQLRQAIEEPARRAGLRLEPGLVDLLVRDAYGEAGGLPLLSHALAETWARREGNVLTVQGYTATGGIRGAVGQSAERLYESLSAEDQHALRSVLERLVTPTAAGDPVAARVPTRIFSGTPDAPRLLDLLVRARLVTTTADTATIAHESLVRAWPRLRTWLDEDADGQRILAHLQVAAEGWDGSGQPDDELYRGARLVAALEWRERQSPMLSEVEVAFLDASTAHERSEERRRTQELAEQRRRNRQLRWAVGGVAGLLVLALVAGTLAAVRGREAQQSADAARVAANRADAARLTTASRAEQRTDLAVLMARQAIDLSPEATREADLLETLTRADAVTTAQVRLTNNNLPAHPIDRRWGGGLISPDGSRALLQVGATVMLVDTATGRPVTTRPLDSGANFGNVSLPAGFVDDGRTAAVSRTSSGPGPHREIVRFDLRTGDQRGDPEAVPGARTDDFFGQDLLRVSPDGSTLVSMLDRHLRVWHRTATSWAGPETLPLPPFPTSIPGGDMLDVAQFSRDGSTVVIRVEYDGPPSWVSRMALAYDLRHRRALSPWVVGVEGVTMAPGGDAWAVARLDGTVEVRSSRHPSRPPVRLTIEPAGYAESLAFSPDSRRLVVGGFDGGLRVYALAPARLLRVFPQAGFPLVVVGLAADDDTVVAVQEFGQISRRSVAGANAVTAVIPTSRSWSVSAGDEGTVVASGLDDGHVVVADQRSMRVVRRLWLGPYASADPTLDPALHRRVTALAVTPDGAAVVAADRSGHLRMWGTSDGRLMWSRDDVPAEQLAVSPDGTTMVTVESARDPDNPFNVSPYCCSDSLWVRIWDLRHRTPLMTYRVEPDLRVGLPMSRPVSYSPDSSLVAVPYLNDGVDVFDVAAARLIRHISPYELTVEPRDFDGAGASGVTFSADGSALLVRLDEHPQVLVLDPRTGARLGAPYLDVHTSDGNLASGPDNRWIFSRSWTELTAWDVSTHQRVLGPTALGGDEGDSLAIVADGYMFVASATGLVRLDVDPQRWEDAACRLAGRTLTEAEWAELLPGRPYTPACAAA